MVVITVWKWKDLDEKKMIQAMGATALLDYPEGYANYLFLDGSGGVTIAPDGEQPRVSGAPFMDVRQVVHAGLPRGDDRGGVAGGRPEGGGTPVEPRRGVTRSASVAPDRQRRSALSCCGGAQSGVPVRRRGVCGGCGWCRARCRGWVPRGLVQRRPEFGEGFDGASGRRA